MALLLTPHDTTRYNKIQEEMWGYAKMIQKKNDSTELAEKISEIELLRKSEAVATAKMMARVSSLLDIEIHELRRQEREGRELISDGVTLDKLNDILRAVDRGRTDDDS